MVILPAGNFLMGSSDAEKARADFAGDFLSPSAPPQPSPQREARRLSDPDAGGKPLPKNKALSDTSKPGAGK
jgi:hypothetical protein